MHSKSWVYCNLKKVILWVSTVNMNIMGLVDHKRGDSKILTLRGDRISDLKIFKGGGNCLIGYEQIPSADSYYILISHPITIFKCQYIEGINV